MVICERCNTENQDGSRYCDECGAALWLAGRISPVSPNGRNGQGEQRERADVTADQVHPIEAKSGAPGDQSARQVSPAAVATASEAHAQLVIERGRSAGKRFPLSNVEAQIGRWDADGGVFPDVDLDDDDPEAKVSRRHARILLQDGEYFIEDLGSTNGTFVNRGRRLAPGDRQALRDGDEIIVGKTFLRFQVKTR
jgi:pSer/pThr/pTyr-binding forkhead associated (FHA) protein